VTTKTIGSVPVGEARYPVPAGAVFVEPKGTNTGTGTKADPYGSVQYAVDKAVSGQTIVLREGTYHEFVFVRSGKALTIQSYPGEPVWFDGAETVTGFTATGSTWVKTGWTYEFDSRVSYTKGQDLTNRFVGSQNPMAGHPDAVWINGSYQREVATAAQVVPGTFYVDEAGDRLIIGTDPTGKHVEASTIFKAFRIQGKDTTIRGFGVKRYATTLHEHGTVSAEVDRITVENLVITDNATIGLYAWATGHVFRNVTVARNGLLGVGANKAHNLVLQDSLVTGNNREQFNWAPSSGGLKFSASDGVKILNNVFRGNGPAGVWFDVSMYDITVVGNTFQDHSRFGLMVELSEKAVVTDNYSVGNGRGIVVYNSGDVDIWNNTLAGNDRTLEFLQDERRQEIASLATKIPWITADISVGNNVLAYGNGGCPILAQDLTQQLFGNDFGIRFDGNLHWRASSTTPSNFACWANGAAGIRSFKTIEEFRAHTGSSTSSVLAQGAAVVTATFDHAASVAAATAAARALPEHIAVAAGTTTAARLGSAVPYRAPAPSVAP
jgi:nitrous oxidase accessory protein NosD